MSCEIVTLVLRLVSNCPISTGIVFNSIWWLMADYFQLVSELLHSQC
jgi:hypothetical protein